MNASKLIQQNIENLIAFWSACGVDKITTPNGCTLNASVNWPNRLWFDFEDRPTDVDVDFLIQHAEESSEPFKIPNWHAEDERMHEALLQYGYEIGMTQELMAAPLPPSTEEYTCQLSLRDVKNQKTSGLWSSIAGEAFGYYIHEPVISGLIGRPGFELAIAYDGETPVGNGIARSDGKHSGDSYHRRAARPSSKRLRAAHHVRPAGASGGNELQLYNAAGVRRGRAALTGNWATFRKDRFIPIKRNQHLYN